MVTTSIINQCQQITLVTLPNDVLEMGFGIMHTAYLSQMNKRHHHQVGIYLSCH